MNYSGWSRFILGGVACGAASGGSCEETRRLISARFFPASVKGADGWDDPAGETGAVGGETVPLPPPAEPIDESIAGTALPLDPAAADEDRRPVAPTALLRAFMPSVPRAIAPPPTKAPVATRSPPERAGDPPRTAAKSFGICQHSIMKMIEAPMISNADIAGLSWTQSFERRSSSQQRDSCQYRVSILRQSRRLFDCWPLKGA